MELAYDFGKLYIDKKLYTSDLILGREGIINKRWWRKEGHRVQKEDIDDILNRNSDIVIFGTGYHGVVKIDEEVINLIKQKGSEVEVAKSRVAVEIFKKALSEGKNAILAIHLTC
ncbi:hypothetical protein Asulf_02082 [Archaeoglobus sulfaticallidus PM70-1]|uniref:Uncharacterized protein n=1 Tax=Archaeoglobus sulfaticallidus PM70-1 TaxID=387631 RepID=N0BID2_9EURY|nr:Mth938-like domain-containing protein [Archaeoglobus sulfaticallidus]AGK62042.1 hypothetical protein Asulf_02082 [Archaeoglobus sulfaticallidus PM70-1]